MIKKIISRLLFLFIGINLFSCLPNSRYNYLLDSKKAKKQNFKRVVADTSKVKFIIPNFEEYRIKSGDWLLVNIKSDKYSQNIDKDFAINNNRSGGNSLGGGSVYLNSYLIDSLGRINLPIIGKVQIRGLTLSAAEEIIEKEVRNFYKTSEIFVQVKNAQLYYSIIGEVQGQGFYDLPSNNISLLEAIAKAGGLNPIANRSGIRLIRMYNGDPQMFTINLNDFASITSPEFYIQPKDIIVIDALPIRQVGLVNPTLKEGASLLFYFTSFFTFIKLF